MCSRSDDVCIFNRVLQQSGSDQTRRVSHVDHQDSAYFICDFTHTFVVPFAGISRAAADNHFRLFAQSNFFHLVVVYTAGFLIQIVFARSVDNAGSVY